MIDMIIGQLSGEIESTMRHRGTLGSGVSADVIVMLRSKENTLRNVLAYIRAVTTRK